MYCCIYWKDSHLNNYDDDNDDDDDDDDELFCGLVDR